MAQFCTAFNILSSYPHIAYVTMIDDDTLVPESTPPSSTVLPGYLAQLVFALLAMSGWCGQRGTRTL